MVTFTAKIMVGKGIYTLCAGQFGSRPSRRYSLCSTVQSGEHTVLAVSETNANLDTRWGAYWTLAEVEVSYYSNIRAIQMLPHIPQSLLPPLRAYSLIASAGFERYVL